MTSTAEGSARRVTINDVAHVARVSRQTVTRAMNDMPGISVATKDRVLGAARELGYHPSRFGRGLVRHDHHTLGLVISNLINPYYPELASAVVNHAAERGWSVVLLDSSGADQQRTMINQMGDQVDALIGYLALDRRELDVSMPGLPVVRIDAGDARHAPCGVRYDHGPGITELVDHLIGRGVRRPVMIDSSPAGQFSTRARDFVKIMDDRGIDVPVLHTGGDQLEHGIRTTEEVIATMPRTDAIMCFNDITAFGALKALRQLGRDVPGDVAVVGMDGLAAGTYVTPQLTSLALDMTEVAALAVDIALGRLNGSIEPGSRAARPKVRHRLVIRESA
ncbi:LacI family DNA-binding transcriptional regulator [Microlunatus soli]|uniref:Transcriptional regulator, LacI family n=1 Tax=Microlunatus soli TaxID=630515 RepID=A0A1H1S5W6_9ACTN|nr:LacI family DNA-binding transcriptional regulator [Microlunatus soli]SDS43178.1 transcriptional regulator, LacI family [Microlunatus soli]